MPSPVHTRGRVDRDEVFLEYTKSMCPVCKVVVDAEINVRDDKVYLRKRCRDHGSFEPLIYGDAEMYAASLRFNKPGTLPLQTQTEIHDGCPLDCGLCPDHKQHACVGLIEVNTACNLDCPVCFADSGHHPDGFSLTREQVEAGLDAFVAAEGEPEVVMFSGGEPSIHPEILDFCELARDKGIRNEASAGSASGKANRRLSALTVVSPAGASSVRGSARTSGWRKGSRRSRSAPSRRT
jgi:7,8-dihydro-6-hydroxymethylpterin dimethyltransferase